MKSSLLDTVKRKDFKQIFENKGYKYFINGDYNLNIIGVRKKGTTVTNKFDDYLVLLYKDKNVWHRNIYPITTTAGTSYMGNKMGSTKGTAILVPGQYRSSWTLGYHKGLYLALVQCKSVKVYRDSDKDNKYDFDPQKIEEGIFGINIHKAGNDSTYVNNWSAGCQVFKKEEDFNSFLNICKQQKLNGKGDKYTYTLLNEEDLYE